MKRKCILRKAVVKSLSHPNGFEITRELYESDQDARDNYHNHLLGLETKAIEVDVIEPDRKKEKDSDLIFPTTAYSPEE